MEAHLLATEMYRNYATFQQQELTNRKHPRRDRRQDSAISFPESTYSAKSIVRNLEERRQLSWPIAVHVGEQAGDDIERLDVRLITKEEWEVAHIGALKAGAACVVFVIALLVVGSVCRDVISEVVTDAWYWWSGAVR